MQVIFQPETLKGEKVKIVITCIQFYKKTEDTALNVKSITYTPESIINTTLFFDLAYKIKLSRLLVSH